ncbi:MAG TPA: hypothetical protein VFT46_03530 [Holophagaceae bacterium]|nr:hypothetical protein [Holophagaceae bacterium]
MNSKMRSIIIGIFLLLPLPSNARGRHPRGPDTTVFKSHKLLIHSGECEYAFTFSAPDGNDPELRDRTANEVNASDAPTGPGGQPDPIEIHWAWGKHWFWQDYDGFLSMTIAIKDWDRPKEAAGAGARVDSLKAFLAQIIEKSIKAGRVETIPAGAIRYTFAGTPSQIEIHSKYWIKYEIVRIPPIQSEENPRYSIGLSDDKYLEIRFDYTNNSGVESEPQANWKDRAALMVERIVSSFELNPSFSHLHKEHSNGSAGNQTSPYIPR